MSNGCVVCGRPKPKGAVGRFWPPSCYLVFKDGREFKAHGGNVFITSPAAPLKPNEEGSFFR